MTKDGPDAVLLVEDDERDIILFRAAFERAGLSNPIIAVRNGQEAADYIDGEAQYADRVIFPLPALLLLDLKMPRMDGFEMLAWLYTRQDLKNIAVVVLSSSEKASDIQMTQHLHADGYLLKPQHAEDWALLVKELSSRWLRPAFVTKP